MKKLKISRFSIQILFIAVFFFNSMLFATGINILNSTGQNLRIRMSTQFQEYVRDLRPRESYFFSQNPYNMIVYLQNGSCSHFYDVGMNSIFTQVNIVPQRGNPSCVLLAFSGKTRTSSPLIIAPIVFQPSVCRRNCWNPATGAVSSELITTVR